MKKILEYLLSLIVQNPKEISVSEKNENDYLTLSVKVHPDDVKTVIGRGGRTIKALRDLLKIKSFSEGKRVNIKIEG